VNLLSSRHYTALDSPEAFTEWVRPHVPAMTRLAGRLAPPGERDDVVQEALTRAWRRRETFDPSRGSPAGWLLAITADRARAARPRQTWPARITDIAARVRSVDDRIDIEHAVSKLATRQRLAVDCFYFADLSIAQTAVVMRCSEGTVKSTLADARNRLRTMLEMPND
jgi:RNA polymerase sigma factor (sigma-70 family)